MKKEKKNKFLNEIDNSVNKKNIKRKDKKNKIHKDVDYSLELDNDTDTLLDTDEIKMSDDFDENNSEKEKKIYDQELDSKFDDDLDDIESDQELVDTKEEKKKHKFLFFKSKKDKNVIKTENNLQDDDLENDKVLDDTSKKRKKHKFLFFKSKKDKNVIKEKVTVDDLQGDEEISEEFIMSKKSKKKNKHKNKKNIVKEKKNKKKRSFWKRLLTFILIMCILGVLALAAFLAYVVVTAPEFNESQLVVQDQTVIYDIEGRVIATLGVEKRESVTYDQLPQVLIDAIIATEDSRFFQHNGVDLFRFIKATVQQLLGHGDAGGASTLTMQAVKNNVTKKDKSEDNQIQKIIRKFQDVYISVFKVEKEYSKEEILELYVNDNYLGGPSIYGVEEACKYYFGKSVTDISLPEASIIAGLFQLPGRYNPYVYPEKTTKRRNLVLKYMYNHGYITKEEMELTKKIDVESLLVGATESKNAYQGYVDTVVEEVEDRTGDNPYKVPMKIYTTMEKSMQDGLNYIFGLNRESSDGNERWYAQSIWKDDKVTAGVAIVNVETGGISAVGPGRNRTGERQFNTATQAHRQPGSTAKPLFDYGPGIEYNNFSSYQLFNDEPWSYTGGTSVSNWDDGYFGLITARRALQVSRNIPALKAFQQVGAKNIQQFVYSLGLDVAYNTESENYRIVNKTTGVDNTINEAYAIGGVAEGFTPLEMATAYAAFANGGYHIDSHTVTKIIYRDTGEEKEFKYPKERVMKDSTAYIINNILESAVTSGFNGGAYVRDSHVAAKTGTSNYDTATINRVGMPSWAVNDLWTCAYTSKYSIAVWYGYEEAMKDYFNTNGGYKDNLTSAVMKYVPKDTVGWSAPSSVVAVTVEKDTWPAQLPSEYTPSGMKTTEYFVRGTQPGEVSPRYQQINDVNNVNVKTNNNNSATITWNFTEPAVVTKSYLEKYFSNSVYGNQKNRYLEWRLGCINNDKCTGTDGQGTTGMGGIGFGIYKLNADGKYERIDFVKDKTYTYKGYGKTELLIKAEYKNFKDNASKGIKVTVSLDELVVEKLTATLNGINKVETSVGEYSEKGIKKVTFGNLDVTNSSEIEYSIEGADGVKTFSTVSELETYVNSLAAGEYVINYNITYLTSKITKTRTVTLK